MADQRTRKQTQRARLIAGLVDAACERGYAGTTVSEVIRRAGVSRPTFYEYFKDRDDCFLAAHRELGARLVAEVERTVAAATPEQAQRTVVKRLVEIAERMPAQAQFLANETMAGGPRALDQHDRLIDAISDMVEGASARARPDSQAPDIPAWAAIGSVRWLLAPPLRRREPDLTALARELDAWLGTYERPLRDHRWRELPLGPALPPLQYMQSFVDLDLPPSRPSGRPRPPGAELARIQREQIMYGTVKAALTKGYNATTVADIATAAKLDRRTFYKHFRDKQQAFLAVHERFTQQLMSFCASAFFSAPSWPDRVWEGLRAAAQFEADHPMPCRIGLIESYALGPAAIQRIDDNRAAFTIFLQEGNLIASKPVSQTTMEAIAGTIFEIGYRHARRNDYQGARRTLPGVTYLALAPFLGPRMADELIAEKHTRVRRHAARDSAMRRT